MLDNKVSEKNNSDYDSRYDEFQFCLRLQIRAFRMSQAVLRNSKALF